MKSTGPTTEAGRQRVSQNARRHGLSTPPEPDDVRLFYEMLMEDPLFAKVFLSHEGDALTRSLAEQEARLKRVRDLESFLVSDCLSAAKESMDDERTAHLIHASGVSDELKRLLRYRKEAEIARHRALRDWIEHLAKRAISKTKPTGKLHKSSAS